MSHSTASPITLIGLTGGSSSMKVEVEQYLAMRHGYRTHNFSEPLRRILYQIDPILPGQVSLRQSVDANGWHAAAYDRFTGTEVRGLIQRLGDTLMEEYGDHTLIDLLTRDFDRADAESGGVENVVVSGIRTIDEGRWVSQRHGVIWEIVREGVAPVNAHRTEQALPAHMIHRTIRHNGERAALFAQVEQALSDLDAHHIHEGA